jgi:hypothetical protein
MGDVLLLDELPEVIAPEAAAVAVAVAVAVVKAAGDVPDTVPGLLDNDGGTSFSLDEVVKAL